MLVPMLRRLDGVAETRELRDRGIRPTQLAAAVAAEDVLRVRRGWYALPETPAALLTAVRIGGRLACVSAAAHYGWATPERFRIGASGVLADLLAVASGERSVGEARPGTSAAGY